MVGAASQIQLSTSVCHLLERPWHSTCLALVSRYGDTFRCVFARITSLSSIIIIVLLDCRLIQVPTATELDVVATEVEVRAVTPPVVRDLV